MAKVPLNDQRESLLRITSIATHVVKAPKKYELQGRTVERPCLTGTDYLYFEPYLELYSTKTEAVIVVVTTDKGVTGYGEAQAPIGPEVVQAAIKRVVGPVVLGKDPLDTGVRFHDMYASLRARGQTTGFQMDAIAAIDMALWDIKGKTTGLSLAQLLGGSFRPSLPCYVSGSLLGPTPELRATEAARHVDAGIAGIKAYLGFGLQSDEEEIRALAAAVGDRGRLLADLFWAYSLPEAIRVGRMLESHGVEFMEAPMAPEDVEGHARLSATLDIAVAIGEPLRTRYQFLPWLRQQALDVCQPDPMRCGISETHAIGLLAEAFNTPVALHNGVVTVVGMAATWQLASVMPNFYIQEYEPHAIDTFGPWLTEPLRIDNGELVVPTDPGLGINLDVDRMMQDVVSSVTIGGQ